MTNKKNTLSCMVCSSKTLKFKNAFKCVGCGHIFRPNKTNYKDKSNRNKTSPSNNKKFQERSNYLQKYLKDNINILEVGCAEGELGRIIKSQFNLRYDGVEISKDIEKSLLNLDHSFNSTNEAPKKFYDLILCFHTLEHIEKLEDEVLKWKNLIKGNSSLLIVEVPNESGNPFLEFDENPEHVHQFTLASLSYLFERNGFKTRSAITGVFESELYSDSVRIVLELSDIKSKPEHVIQKINNFSLDGLYIYGIGGDYKNYISPIIDKIKVKGLLDSSEKLMGRSIQGYKIHPMKKEYSNEKFLISSHLYVNDIRKYLLDAGVALENILTIAEVYSP